MDGDTEGLKRDNAPGNWTGQVAAGSIVVVLPIGEGWLGMQKPRSRDRARCSVEEIAPGHLSLHNFLFKNRVHFIHRGTPFDARRTQKQRRHPRVMAKGPEDIS